jgi:hypothetical protein
MDAIAGMARSYKGRCRIGFRGDKFANRASSQTDCRAGTSPASHTNETGHPWVARFRMTRLAISARAALPPWPAGWA